MATERDTTSGKSGITQRLKQDSKDRIETTKRSAADQIDQVAQALNRAGEELGSSQPTIANYAGQIASSVSNFATRLRDGSLDDLLNDTRQLARRNPGMFLLGGVALGFALSRFLKASAEDTYADTGYGSEDYSGDYAGDFGGDYAGEGSSGAYTGSAQGYGDRDPTLDVESGAYSGSSTRSRDDFSGSRTNGG